MRKTDSLLLAVQNNAIMTNYMEVKVDYVQRNSKCRIYGERDETNNHIISECSKLA